MADFNRSDLDTPVAGNRRKFFNFDGDSVGAFAEKVARFFGTGEYLFWQTIFVLIWVAFNVGGYWWNWDAYPFILLNLAFSTQAAYAAPLILLAQNRQEDRVGALSRQKPTLSFWLGSSLACALLSVTRLPATTYGMNWRTCVAS